MAVLMICLFSLQIVAGTNPGLTIVSSGDQTFALYLHAEKSTPYFVKLKDASGHVLLMDKIAQPNAFSRKYNLENLPDGNYFVFVEGGSKTVVQPITMQCHSVVIDPDAQLTLFAPAVRIGEGKVDFTLLCLDETKVTIEINDDLGQKIYTGTSDEQGSIQRRFDISSLEDGSYRIVTTVRDGNVQKHYSEFFTVGDALARN